MQENLSEDVECQTVQPNVEDTRTHDLSNAEQVSLFAAQIENIFTRQREILTEHIDARLDQSLAPTTPILDDFAFKSEGNKLQFKFNSARCNGLVDISRAVKQRDFAQVETLVKRETEALKERNKLIKIADRHGWDTVNEYTPHPLADDSDDATKLRTAIARASRNRKARSSAPYSRPIPATSTTPPAILDSQNRPFRRNDWGFPTTSDGRVATSQTQHGAPFAGACFHCHLRGHFARDCPYVRQTFSGSRPSTGQTTPSEAADARTAKQ